jgi:hypothetical protein
VIFAISIGSEGSGLERFVLYVPFVVAPGRQISGIDTSGSYRVAGYDVCLEKLTNIYALTIGPFETEQEARQFFPKLRAALLWVSLKHNVGINYPRSVTDVTLIEGPTPVPDKGMVKQLVERVGWDVIEGFYDADKAVARPEAKKLIRWEMGRPSVIAGIGADNFAKCIKEALSFSAPDNVVKEERLQLAIDLYSAFFFELSDKAQFIALVTVLEALTPDSEVPDIARTTLESAKSVVKQKRNSFTRDAEEWKDLDHLLSRIGKLKQQAIGASIRHYFSGVVQDYSELGDPREVSNKLRDVYKNRSLLLHEGDVDEDSIKDGLRFLREFVPKVLEKLYIAVAQDRLKNSK